MRTRPGHFHLLLHLFIVSAVLNGSACFLFKEPLEHFLEGDQSDIDMGSSDFGDVGSDTADTGPDTDCRHGVAVCADENRVQVCNRGAWDTPEPCSEGLTCLEGECVSENYGHNCVSSEHCRDGLTCWFGYCLRVANVEEGGECHSYFECQPGLHCTSRTCVRDTRTTCDGANPCEDLETPYCSPDGFCHAGTWRQPCENDGHCNQELGYSCVEREQTEMGTTHTLETCENGEHAAGCASVDDCGDEFPYCLGYTCYDGTEYSVCGSDEHCAESRDHEGEHLICVRMACRTGRDGSNCYPDEGSDDGEDHCQEDYFCAPACAEVGDPRENCDSYACTSGSSWCESDDDCIEEMYCGRTHIWTCLSGMRDDWCNQERSDQCVEDNPYCTARGCQPGERGYYCDDDDDCKRDLRCVHNSDIPLAACDDGSEGASCSDDDEENDCLPDYPHCAHDTCQIGDHGSPCDDDDDCNEGLSCIDAGLNGNGCMDGTRGDICVSRDDCIDDLTCVDHHCND